MSETEIWKDIPGYEGLYQVSSLGRVKSLDKPGKPNKVSYMKQYVDRGASQNGSYVCLCRTNKQRWWNVNNIVAAAFWGEQYLASPIWNVDSDHTNAKLSNLTTNFRDVPFPDKFRLTTDEKIADVPGYEEKYAVTTTGRIFKKPTIDPRNHATEWVQILGTLHPSGYRKVTLQGKNIGVHRLVAKAFIPNPYNKQVVDHINTDKDDNSVKNLRWCTQKENMNNLNTRKNMLRYKKVLVVNMANMSEEAKVFCSVKECAKHYGVVPSTVSRWLAGRSTPHKFPNLVFSYAAPPSIKETINDLAQRMNSMSEQQCIAELQEYLQEVTAS